MPILARAMFGLVSWAARKGLAESPAASTRSEAGHKARRTGVRGETYAYWFLRRNGYVMIARNFTYRGVKGEIDLVGYDGKTLAFVEVKTRTSARDDFGSPEDAVTTEKQQSFANGPAICPRIPHARRALSDLTSLQSKPCPAGRPLVRLAQGRISPPNKNCNCSRDFTGL